jgi:serine protease Do
MTLAPLGVVAGAEGEGVAVIDVSPDGPAAEHGIKAGDVILAVGDKPVASPADVRKALADARSANKRTVLMRLRSGDAMRFVALPIANT